MTAASSRWTGNDVYGCAFWTCSLLLCVASLQAWDVAHVSQEGGGVMEWYVLVTTGKSLRACDSLRAPAYP